MADTRRRRNRFSLAAGARSQHSYRHSEQWDESDPNRVNRQQPDHRFADAPRRRSRFAARPRCPALQDPLFEAWADPPV